MPSLLSFGDNEFALAKPGFLRSAETTVPPSQLEVFGAAGLLAHTTSQLPFRELFFTLALTRVSSESRAILLFVSHRYRGLSRPCLPRFLARWHHP
jgi:hypothetical protein